MPFSLAVLGSEKRLHQIPGDGRTNRATTHTEDIHVIILDSLSSRKVIVNQTGTNTCNLVGCDRCADAAATDGQATLNFACSDSLCQRNDEVGIVISGIQMMSAEINHLMSCLAKLGNDLLF